MLGIAALLGLGGYGAYRAFKPKRREDEEVKQSSAVKTAAPAPGPVPGPVPEPALSRLGMGGLRALGRYGAVHPARAFVPKPGVAPNQKLRGGAALSRLGPGMGALSRLGRGGAALPGLGLDAYRAFNPKRREAEKVND